MVLEFERVRQDYVFEDARGIPMSVRERYERALGEMRARIRAIRGVRTGRRLGELLVEQGALGREELQEALVEQRRRDNGELLGEVLVDMGLIEEEMLLSALRIQADEN